MIAIIDYGMGNLRSVEKALEASGAREVFVTSKIKDIHRADKIVMPGVGAMKEAMAALKRLKLIEPLKEIITQKPYLGICLGLQLLFEKSEEGSNAKGLGILNGQVVRFPNKVKVPHMGWNQIKVTSKNSKNILKGILEDAYFYFCHSYYVVPEDKSIISAQTEYGLNFTSAICKDNIFAVQFHPEKSQRLGLKLLEKFIKV